MGKIQVLVATMHQNDFSLVHQMNIRCDAILANQAECENRQVQNFTFGKVTMITTAQRGVGRNRNTALDSATSDILLFADDDVIYQNDMPMAVTEAFQSNPDADVIIFSMDYTRNGQLIEQRHLQKHRMHLYNSLRFGAVSIAVRRSSMEKAGIRFNENFGGGCKYSSGEDSLFLRDCYRNRLHVYSHDYVLGRCARDSSSWFTGYNKKYFFDKGVLMGCLFPRFSYLMTLYFAIRFKRKTEISAIQRIRLMYRGLLESKHVNF